MLAPVKEVVVNPRYEFNVSMIHASKKYKNKVRSPV